MSLLHNTSKTSLVYLKKRFMLFIIHTPSPNYMVVIGAKRLLAVVCSITTIAVLVIHTRIKIYFFIFDGNILFYQFFHFNTSLLRFNRKPFSTYLRLSHEKFIHLETYVSMCSYRSLFAARHGKHLFLFKHNLHKPPSLYWCVRSVLNVSESFQ